MLRYLLANLLAPLLRPMFNAVLVVMVVAFAVTIPARLWVTYVDPRPSYNLIAVLNVATFVLLLCGVVVWRIHRRAAGRRYWPKRQ